MSPATAALALAAIFSAAPPLASPAAPPASPAAHPGSRTPGAPEPAAPAAGGWLVCGSERAVYRIENPAGLPFLRDYRNDGFAQSVRWKSPTEARVTVEVDASPLDPLPVPPSRPAPPDPPRPAGAGPAPPEARFLTATPAIPAADPRIGEFALAAASALPAGFPGPAPLAQVVDAVSAGTRVRTDRDAPRGALETLRSGEGSCVGRSRFAIAALRSLGVPARSISGLLFRRAPGRTEEVSPAMLHRWIESAEPGGAWVFSDPGATSGYASARHIVLFAHGPDEDPLPATVAGTRVTLLSIEGDLAPAERAPGLRSAGLRVRPLRPVPSEGAALVGTGASPGHPVRLRPDGGAPALVARADERGLFWFAGLPPAGYLLVVPGGGSARFERRVRLEAGTRTVVEF